MLSWGTDLAVTAAARPWIAKTAIEKVAAGAVCAVIPITGTLRGQFPAQAGGMQPHVTVLFQKDVLPSDVVAVKAAIARAAASVAAFEIRIGGLDHFHSDDQSVAFAKVVGDGVMALRVAIELELQSEGIRASQHEGGFVPHATIAYLEPGMEWTGAVPEGVQMVKTIEVWTSAGSTSYNLAPSVAKAAGDVQVEFVAKADGAAADEQYVLGIVLIPETVDTQGDIYSEEAVRLAAFDYMARFSNGSGQTGLQHKGRLYTEVALVESYVAPVEFKIGDKLIRRGTWLMGWRILDAELWRKIKAGEYTGFSIGGTARKTPLRS